MATQRPGSTHSVRSNNEGSNSTLIRLKHQELKESKGDYDMQRAQASN